MGKRIFLASAMVSKNQGTFTIHSTVFGLRLCETEDEARGSMFASAAELKPGFSVDDISVVDFTDRVLDLAKEYNEQGS